MELALNEPATQVVLAVLFLLPGLNATWIVERLTGPTRLKGTERLLRALSLSMLIYTAASWWLVRLAGRLAGGAPSWVWEPILGLIILIFIAPVLLAFVVSFLRSSPHAKRFLRRFTTVDPTPRAWDYAFHQRGARFARIKLKDGKRVGGLFGGRSFASAYPEEEDVFLEQVWRLRDEGEFDQPVPGSGGLVIPKDSILLVEFLEPREVEPA